MEYTTTLTQTEPIVITIGNFDGIHRGHQYLLHTLCVMAEQLSSKPVLVTFSPHPLEVVRPGVHLQLLSTLDEKLALAREYGKVADSIVVHFTPEVAAMTAEEFMDNLRQHFTIKGLVVGADFRLGHNRMGDVAFLQQYGQQHEFEVAPVPLQEDDQQRISSTRIRKLIEEGNIVEANTLLGHPFEVSGVVFHGDKRGRLLGFPTANVRPGEQKLLPADGVYAAYVRVVKSTGGDEAGASTVYNGAVNVGLRPTFDGKVRQVEAHLLDVELDLYDKEIRIDFIARLRGEQKFAGIEALKTQLSTDIQQARQILTARRVSN
ncbi:riboflavin kinase/FMN adenylyltransferase [Thermosporothrix hazakensis]|jgi:riboflavin kinase/FMN adenylyltransferase|uniref:Riboflavin biosynthesis protein n=2 Tax=Thermosporothrix TaxID=768650 RepID=A0A326UD29_THEHA|nr:bifunctional riboflavin kinase/FAD synthetase [Thermosporothrix hazakensis]PZW36417.1 riboflavin kinase/FMN adenylyltransferase [Thermosporothrix hazakensis]